MVELIPLERHHYPTLITIQQQAEPFAVISPVAFGSLMDQREGFTVRDRGEILGCVSFSDHIPLLNIVIHAFVRPDRFGTWYNRTILRQMHAFPFEDLDLPRVTGLSIEGLTPKNDEVLLKCGFNLEGIMRHAVRIGGLLHNVRMYGLLREERRF